MSETESEKKSSRKKYLIWGVVGIIVVLVLFGVYQTIQIKNMFEKAAEFSKKEQQFNQITKSIDSETARCKTIIAQQQGEFASFEYCKQYINWANSLPDQ